MTLLLNFILHPFQTIEEHRFEAPAGLSLLAMFLVWVTVLAQAWWGHFFFFLFLAILFTFFCLMGHLAYVGLMDWVMQIFAQKSRFMVVASWLGLCYLPISLGISVSLLTSAIPVVAWLSVPLNLGLLIWSGILSVRVLRTQYQVGVPMSLLLLSLPLLVASVTVLLMIVSLFFTLL